MLRSLTIVICLTSITALVASPGSIVLMRHQIKEKSLKKPLKKLFTSARYTSLEADVYADTMLPLSVTGWHNAMQLVPLLTKTLDFTIKGLYTLNQYPLEEVPTKKGSKTIKGYGYLRTTQTLLPLFTVLKKEGLAQNTIYDHYTADPQTSNAPQVLVKQLADLFQDIMSQYTQCDTVVVCWEHHALPVIAQTFGLTTDFIDNKGTKALETLQQWPSSVFNWLWVLNYNAHQKLESVDQYVIPCHKKTGKFTTIKGADLIKYTVNKNINKKQGK